MQINRRRALQTVALLPIAVTSAAADADTKNGPASSAAFTGSWHVTKGITSFVLSIEPQEEASYLRIENGAFNIGRVKWKPMPGGILLLCLPRLRLWAGRDASEIRAEREDYPRTDVSDAFKQFPLAFFMSRVKTAGELLATFVDRPLPAGWDSAVLAPDWDQRAGNWNK